MSKLKGFFRLLRFELPFSAGICVVMGQLLALEKFASLYMTIVSFFSIFTLSASILVLNDFFDIETDKINAPHRPIPSNMVTPTEALLFSIVLMIVGFVLSILLNITTLLLAVILFIVGLLYNRRFKKSGLPGNLMVSFSVGMTFIYGAVSVNIPFNRTVLLFGVIAALIDLGEEIAADVMDMEGDKIINSNSLAIRLGKQAALKISAFIFSCVVFISLIPFVFNLLDYSYVIPIAVMDTAIVYSIIRLMKAKNKEGRRYIRWIYLGATFGLLIFIAMKLLKT